MGQGKGRDLKKKVFNREGGDEVQKHLCWSCGSWKTCKDVSQGGAKLCDRWVRRTYKEILEGGGRRPKDFHKRVVEVRGWLLD